MTAQKSDLLVLDQGKFLLLGVNGGNLFIPARFGLHPIPSTSACWRGCICQYAVHADRLVLDELKVNLKPADTAQPGLVGPAINGIQPVVPEDGIRRFNHQYHQLNRMMPFSGGLLAGTGFIWDLYVHMGFHPAWKFRTVFELIIFDGQVTEVRDVSETMAAIRAVMAQKPLEPDSHEAVDLSAWIASTFKLNYNL